MQRQKYSKLVRDKIPQIIQADGGIPVIRTLSLEEFLSELEEKLGEEVQEFRKERDPLKKSKELADVYEVFKLVVRGQGLTFKKLRALATQKRKERGGFSKRIFLKYVDTLKPSKEK